MLTFENKAKTIETLSKLKTTFLVPSSYSFSVGDWKARRSRVVGEINSRFGGQRLLAVRSSALSEDRRDSSNAGAFVSQLNVDGNDTGVLASVIDEVAASYSDDNESHMILVQPMVQDIDVSGVIMTRNVANGSPYYVINYDDLSGRTDTVTGGIGAHKAVLIHRRAPADAVTSDRVRRMLEIGRELENICGETPLDIEFCISRSAEAYVLQVRPIAAVQRWPRNREHEVDFALAKIEEAVIERSQRSDGLLGEKSTFGTMPDWNPAEILGPVPRPLATSLYEQIVTNVAWRQARQMMGYRSVPARPLLVRLANIPYVDVRLSLNSFIPATLDARIADRLVTHWIERLDSHPELHDKLEFQVAQTALNFDFDSVAAPQLRDALQSAEIVTFRAALTALTSDCISMADGSNWQVAMALLRRLEMLQSADPVEPSATPAGYLHRAAGQLDRCAAMGTVSFAMFARHAFIGEALLRSARNRGALAEERLQAFKRSIRTVMSDLNADLQAVTVGRLSREDFLAHYGHLRPGTYDITSLRYADRPEVLSADAVLRDVTHADFFLTSRECQAIEALLGEHGLDGLTAPALLDYAARAITMREYGKFVFTRDLSAALENIKRWGNSLDLSPDALSYLEYDDLLRTLYAGGAGRAAPLVATLSEQGRQAHELSTLVRLSYLIRDVGDVRVVPIHRSAPNFVTSQSVTGNLVFLDSHTEATADLTGKIVCIESADPGFDWIFLRDIGGLITKYGGANSHMAIRAAELGLPAAIGCGELGFAEAMDSSAVELRCGERVMRFLNHAV